MDDQKFLDDFEDGRFAAESFTHQAHIRLAYLYLSRGPFLEACIAMRDSLQEFSARIGKRGLYHETITIAFMSIVNERMSRHPDDGWRQLIAAYPELCDKDILTRYLAPDILNSPKARTALLLSERT